MTPPSRKKSDFRLIVRGTRGSFPVSGKQFLKYGGNSTCYEIRAGGCLFIVDAGTGIINLGKDLLQEYLSSGSDPISRTPIEAVLLFTHTHIDHIQGLPFFVPISLGDTTLYIYGPDSPSHKFEEALNTVLNPPLFPITVDDMNSLKLFRTVSRSEAIFWSDKKGIPLVLNKYREASRIQAARKEYPVEIDCMKSTAHPLYGSMIYKFSYKGKSIVVATDTEGYVDGDTRLINFSKGADLLLHDAGYTREVYSSSDRCTQGYGHSTMEMAVEVAKKAGVKQLALIHHEPGNDDKLVDRVEKQAQELFPNTCAAYEGQVFEL